MKQTALIALFVLGLGTQASAQLKGIDVVKTPEINFNVPKQTITIPDVNGYKALKCDFHMHTVFSDGAALPKDRVIEAAARGIDAIAITDHIEYLPNKEWINADFNKSYQLAEAAAQKNNILVIHGSEITRSKPLGHLNALFINDGNPLKVDDPLKAIDAAKAQGAFIMWNHPGWPNDTATLYPVHEELIKQGKINGIEVVNSHEYYPVAFNYCKEKNLAYMGCTDAHGPILFSYDKFESAPYTIVFAAERSIESIKEALLAKRSVVKFGSILIGSEANLKALTMACLSYDLKSYNAERAEVSVTNKSTLPFELTIGSQIVKILANQTLKLKVPLKGKIVVSNTYITDNSQLEIDIESLR